MTYLLSEPVENLIQDKSCEKFDEHCDVLIVGSGYGGAIAAMRLANKEENRRVYVFERGKEYTLGEFPESLGDIPGHIQFLRPDRDQPVGYPDGLFDFRINDPVSALVGCGLGGGSLINANVAMEPGADLYSDPQWPSALRDPAVLSDYFKDVRKLLGVQPPNNNSKDVRNVAKYESLKHLAEKLGATSCQQAEIAVTEEDGRNDVNEQQKGCVKCGNCVTGCNIGAKNTLAMNALPLAKDRDARLFTGVTVLSVEPNGTSDGSQGWMVCFRRTATSKTVLHKEVFTLRTKVVILAAGTFGSTEILLRSREKHQLAFSGELGKRFSTNGDVLAFGFAQKKEVNAVAHADVTQPWDPRSPRGIGPTITGFFHAQVEGKGGGRRKVTIEDGAIPSALAHAFGEIVTTASLAKRYKKDEMPAWFTDSKNNPNNELDPLTVYEGALRNSQVLLAMGDDRAQWSLDLKYPEDDPQKQDHDRVTIRINTLSRSQKDDLAENSVFADVDRLFEQAEEKDGFDGGDYLPNPFWKLLPKELAQVSKAPAPGGQLLTVHPLGGCGMGDDATKGVVNDWGQVFRPDGRVYKGLYVLDGAILPCALGVNPFLTIAALAYRNVAKVAEDLAPINNGRPWSLQGVGKVQSGHLVEPPLPPPVPAHNVGATFVEWMTGRIDEVPPWLINSFLIPNGEDVRRLNEKDRLVLKVQVEVPDVLGWLREPNKPLNAPVSLSLNRGATDPVQDEDLRQKDLIKLADGTGRVELLAWDQPLGEKLEERQQDAIEAFVERRPEDAGWLLRLGWRILSWGIIKWLARGNARLNGYLRVAKNHANWRTLDYSFEFGSGASTLRLKGKKRLTYKLFKIPSNKPYNNPWTALVELPITLSNAGGESVEGLLGVDLIRLTRRAPFQIDRSPNTPVAIAAMASAGMMLLRVLFQTHFWSFGAPDYPEERLIGNRDPGPVWLGWWTKIEPEFIEFQVPESAGDPTKQITLRLARYKPEQTPRGSILLVHGFALSSLVFATDKIEVNLVKYLYQNGYDVWLLDYRLSIALPYAAQQWTMDQIAKCDMHAAVKEIYERTGREAGEPNGKPIQVFVHCIGSGSMAMAILSRQCYDSANKRSMISALATHAVHPWVVPSVVNHVKANLGAFFRDGVTRKTFDAVLPDATTVTASDVLMDRIAGSLPWPSDEEGKRHRTDTDKGEKGKEICNRMTLFYSYEWKHSNLTEKTHKALADLVGIANAETFRHIYLTLVRRRLTNSRGENEYVTDNNFRNYWIFPTLFAHGSDNQVYSPLSAVRSYLRLRALRPSTGPIGATKSDVYWHEVPNCGHMDFLFGKNAHETVYPYLDAFFRLAQNVPPNQMPEPVQAAAHELQTAGPERRPDPYWEQRLAQPTCGPIIGDVRKDGTNIVLRMWVEPFAFSAASPSGNHTPPEGPNIRVERCELPDPDPNADYPGTYWVYDVTVPETFSQDLRVSIDYSEDPADIRFKVESVPPDAEKELHDPSEGVRIPLSRLPWFQQLRQLQVGKPPDRMAFLVGSCRYPGSPFEEDLADAIFVAMLDHVEGSKGVDHVLLVGDQIYADATADIFDTRELRERFAGRYREAFGAENLQRLLASVPTYMALDDHEFDDNWPGDAAGLPNPNDPVVRRYTETFRHGLAAAKAYQWSMTSRTGWPSNPITGRPAASGRLWYTFESGGLPFFVMDTRTERRLRQASVSRTTAQIVGPRQFGELTEWLDRLAQGEHKNKPKFIVSGSVLAPAARDFTRYPDLYRSSDGWAGYPETWRELVKYIVKEGIQKVVFLSGDYHISALSQLTLRSNSSGKEPVTAYQIVASAFFAPLPFANAHPDDYNWGPPPQSLPFSDNSARLEFEPYLLSTNNSHFLRVDVQPAPASAGSPRWEIRVSVWGCVDGRDVAIALPGETIAALAGRTPVPFATATGNVVRWTL